MYYLCSLIIYFVDDFFVRKIKYLLVLKYIIFIIYLVLEIMSRYLNYFCVYLNFCILLFFELICNKIYICKM